MRDTLNDVINSCRLHAEKKRQQIKLIIDDNIPKFLKFDPSRLQQIINNLMSNAIKFSEEDNDIRVECCYLPEKEQLQVSVIDSGLPIGEQEAKLLFRPYKTLESAKEMNAAGPGLGLYVCKQLCKQLEGDIVFENKLSGRAGAKAFVLNIKATEPTDSTTYGSQLDLDSIQLSTVAGQSKILIFEDNFIGQIALENIFYEELKLKESVSFYNNGK